MSVYRVTGRRMYREHRPGETFEADLDLDVERRAIDMGAIEVVHEQPVTLQPGSWTLAAGHPTHRPEED